MNLVSLERWSEAIGFSFEIIIFLNGDKTILFPQIKQKKNPFRLKREGILHPLTFQNQLLRENTTPLKV